MHRLDQSSGISEMTVFVLSEQVKSWGYRPASPVWVCTNPSTPTLIAATKAGAAARANRPPVVQPRASSQPPIVGPTIEPMRPTPNAHPTPVERIAAGYIPAARAFIPI